MARKPAAAGDELIVQCRRCGNVWLVKRTLTLDRPCSECGAPPDEHRRAGGDTFGSALDVPLDPRIGRPA